MNAVDVWWAESSSPWWKSSDFTVKYNHELEKKFKEV